MKTESQNLLLKVARNSIISALGDNEYTPPRTDDPDLLAKRGCFVTLKNHGELRGCLGVFVSEEPLIDMVSKMAKEAALDDPRFFLNRITPDELNDIDIEISVLSELKRTDDPLSLRLGIDGIYITKGISHGCFLPQVATETGWTKEEFLSYCCSHKAGLAPDAWKDPATRVFLFTAQAFAEKKKQ